MKILVYVLLAFSVVFCVSTCILLTIAFSSQERAKKWQIIGFTSLGVLALTFSCYLVTSKIAKEHYVKYLYDINGITENVEENDFTLKVKDNNIYYYIEDNLGNEKLSALNVDSVKIVKSEYLNPSVYKVKETWEMKVFYKMIVPTYTCIINE